MTIKNKTSLCYLGLGPVEDILGKKRQKRCSRLEDTLISTTTFSCDKQRTSW